MYTSDQYQIGIDYQRKLTWQLPAMLIVIISIICFLGWVALLVFVTPKLAGVGIIVIGFSAVAIAVGHLTDANFKLWPYKVDSWKEVITACDEHEKTMLHLLDILLKKRSLNNFVDIDELLEEAFDAIKYFRASSLTKNNLEEFNVSLLGLIEQCDIADKVKSDREPYDSVVKSALKVAETVNEVMK